MRQADTFFIRLIMQSTLTAISAGMLGGLALGLEGWHSALLCFAVWVFELGIAAMVAELLKVTR